MDWNGQTVLVTGAGGFIGSHLCERLVRAGATTRAFVRYGSRGGHGWLDTLPAEVRSALQVTASDIRDRAAVERAVEGCDIVLHLAALIGIPYSYLAPESYVATNVTGTLNILMAARGHGVERIVCTSTSEVYGTGQFVPITEDHPLVGQSPYAATKIGADQLALSFHRSFDLPVAIARPFNTYGPRQSARAVIPTIVSQIAAGRTRIELGSLHPTRDFTYVADTVGGLLAVAASTGAVGEVVNIGSSQEISVGDLAALIADVMGVAIEIVQDEARARPQGSEVDRLFGSNAKAAQLVGWAPDYAGRDGLRRGLTETATWFRDPENLALYRPDEYAV